MLARALAYALLAIGACAPLLTDAADFNGDGKHDVLWRLPSGKPLIWHMNGLTVAAQQTVALAAGADASIIGSGRFFLTGSPAIALLDSSDNLRLWQINGNGIVVQNCIAASGVDPAWKFLALADVNSDGRNDVLWRLDDGSVVASLMDGCNAPTTVHLSGVANSGWTFAGSGRAGAPNQVDLMWTDAGANNLIVWVVGSAGDVTQGTIPAGLQAGWAIAAVADFNGDQRADILWRNPNDNALTLWINISGGYNVATVTAASADVFGPADGIFANGFDSASNKAPPLTADWTILSADDYNGDGNADLLLATSAGDSAVWLMSGASVQATARFAPIPDMPLPGLTGWRLPLDRPAVTKVDGHVSVSWNILPGWPSYTVYASATNAPASTGTAIANAPQPLFFERTAAGYADKRYFATSASYHGLQLPPSKEAYIVEFTQVATLYFGAMSITDNNGDGCADIFRAIGDCHGGFTYANIGALGLTALFNDPTLRDMRFADFDGDGIPDFIANVYSCDVFACGEPAGDSQIRLFFGNPDGSYTESAAFAAMSVPGGGFGETIVIADFNNDGCLDVFLPKYTFYDPTEHNFLMINDCHGSFTDVADAAGVAQRNVNQFLRAEGAQALDINADGRIDIYAGSQLFINNGDLTFTNVGMSANLYGQTAESPWGLPAQMDEGAKFVDLDNSGQLSLVLNAMDTVRVLRFNGVDQFVEQAVIPSIYMNQSWGLTAADVDGDGRTDLVVAGGIDQTVETAPAYRELKARLAEAAEHGDLDLDDVLDTSATPNALPQLLLNRDGAFVLHDFYDDGLTAATRAFNDLQTFADFDLSGTMDLASRFTSGSTTVLMNQVTSRDIVTVTLLGIHGEQNQQGRVVWVTSNARPTVTMTQVVDSGSGYMSNGPYDLTFATPYFGAYTISVRFADATYTAVAHSGDHVMMYANGTVLHQ